MKRYPIQVLFREYLEGILAAVFLALFLRFFVVNVLYMPTETMEPTLKRGDFVLGWRLSYGFPLPLMKGERVNGKTPQRGDLVSLLFPGDNEQTLIRRVIAVGGDKVAIEEGQVMINGQPLHQELRQGQVYEFNLKGNKSYPIVPNVLGRLQKMTVPEGHFFVLSDNRSRLDDSRDWGAVSELNLESQVVLIWLSVANTSQGLRVLWDRNFSWIE